MGYIYLCVFCGAELNPQPKEIKNEFIDCVCEDCKKTNTFGLVHKSIKGEEEQS